MERAGRGEPGADHDEVHAAVSAPSVVGYLRVSTDEQAQHGLGLDVQRERIEAFCQRERLKLISLHVDPGVSGATDITQRPGLSSALADISAGNAEALVVARFDRLARDTLQALLIERAFTDAGGRVLYAEGFNDDEDGAQFVREVLSRSRGGRPLRRPGCLTAWAVGRQPSRVTDVRRLQGTLLAKNWPTGRFGSLEAVRNPARIAASRT